MEIPYVDIHTHRPTGRHIELRAAGIHPWAAQEADPDALPTPGRDVRAIGEIGLDYARNGDRAQQERLFRAQLAQAERMRLPVVLHCVRAFEPVMKILKEYDVPAVIFHGFVGSPQQAAAAVARGYYLSFGWRSFASPKSVDALRTTPSDRLFFETDDGEPPIESVYARAAELTGTSAELLKKAALANYQRIFG